ncbi:MAG: WapI family immunity protein, partial [Deinococcus sp.]
HRYEFPEATDYHDANWLLVTAEVNVPGQSWVRASGPFLMTSDFAGFQNSLQMLDLLIEGEASLSPIEPVLSCVLRGNHLGQVEGEIELSPDSLNRHHFKFQLDQSCLNMMIVGIGPILERFPVRAVSEGGEETT